MKCEKITKAHHILLMTRRFNEMSRAVTSEILRQTELSKRVIVIEKWAAVADICRCLHNFNGVLQICAAFTNSSIFRLKKTWEKVSKTVSFIFHSINIFFPAQPLSLGLFFLCIQPLILSISVILSSLFLFFSNALPASVEANNR